MNIRLVHDTGIKGEHEYILVGIRRWEDIDTIKGILVKDFNVKIQSSHDGIWSRSVTMEKENSVFELIYHEDIGIFFRSVRYPVGINEKLEKMIEELIPIIEVSLNMN